MPSPRAVLADITNFKLDPKKEYKLGKKHLNVASNQGKKEIVKDKEAVKEPILNVVATPVSVSSTSVVVETITDMDTNLNINDDLINSENKEVAIDPPVETPVEETPTVTQSSETETKLFQSYKKRTKKN